MMKKQQNKRKFEGLEKKKRNKERKIGAYYNNYVDSQLNKNKHKRICLIK
jgi:hypothetical protein